MRISLNWLKRYVDVSCSAQELGRKLTMVGFPVPSFEGVGDDFALEVEVTSNRPDLLSHLGMAREVAGLVGAQVRFPRPALPERDPGVVDVQVLAPDLCPRYTARLIRGVRTGPSPPWLVRLLEAAGQRSVNSVVDVTNFVMLACGQPLHAFDLAKLRGGRIVVRRAEGESMTAIDGTKLVVGRDEIAICDAERPVALGGVMGGLDSEVTSSTVDVVLECAAFAPLAIRAASRAHQIRSEAAHRFERFVDAHAEQLALDAASALLVDLCGAQSIGLDRASLAPGSLRDATVVEVRSSRATRVLGVPIEDAEVRDVLSALGFHELSGARAGATRWGVPSWRPDVTSEIDLVEEVARRIGFDRVPGDVRIPVRPAARDERRRALRRLRDALVGAGLRECCTAPFVGAGPFDIALLRDVPALRVENPMRSDESLLRRSLLGPLLAVARGNRDRGVRAVRLFELAPVYLRGDSAKADDERLLVAGVVTGTYADAKGCVEAILESMGLASGATYGRGARPPLRGDRSATVVYGGESIGCVGELGRRALGSFGLEAGTAVFELDAGRIAAIAEIEAKYKPIPRFPAIERDLAFVVDESVSWHDIEATARAAAGETLAAIRPFDIYRGSQIGGGKKSVALRMELRSTDRTLTGADADACVARVVDSLAAQTGGHLRS